GQRGSVDHSAREHRGSAFAAPAGSGGSRDASMPIAVDAMGGDHAPQSTVEGAVRAAEEDGASIFLVGDNARIDRELVRLGVSPSRPAGYSIPAGKGRIEIVHADEVVGMDEPAITPIRRKRH